MSALFSVIDFPALKCTHLLRQVVGTQYNDVNPQCSSQYYETIYSLLDSQSSEYRSTFCETLSHKLLNLQRNMDEDTSDDQMDTK